MIVATIEFVSLSGLNDIVSAGAPSVPAVGKGESTSSLLQYSNLPVSKMMYQALYAGAGLVR